MCKVHGSVPSTAKLNGIGEREEGGRKGGKERGKNGGREGRKEREGRGEERDLEKSMILQGM